jgi:hypothetical protein
MSLAASPDVAHALFESRERRKTHGALGWLTALAVHAGLIGLVSGASAPARAALRPVEVEFLPPDPAPMKEPGRPAPPPESAQRPLVPSAARSAPAAARAGVLVTAKADAPASQQPAPVDFTTDPNGTSYGGGVVAVGGKADFGAKGAQAAGRGAAPVESPVVHDTGETLVPLADLSRRPQLDEADPCRGYFPHTATDDDARVSLRVIIGRNGRVTNALLLSESPLGQGFGAAAKTCMLSKRLVPALDRDGNPAATATRINLRFSR